RSRLLDRLRSVKLSDQLLYRNTVLKLTEPVEHYLNVRLNTLLFWNGHEEMLSIRRDIKHACVSQWLIHRNLESNRLAKGDVRTSLNINTPTWAPQLPGSLDRSILLPHVHGVSFVFQAVVIHKFAVQHQRLVELHCPRRGICLRIVDRDLDFEVPVVRPPDSFDRFALLRQR